LEILAALVQLLSPIMAQVEGVAVLELADMGPQLLVVPEVLA
jgi:hypothetical protein